MEKFKKYINILDKGLNALFIAFLVVSIVMAFLAVVGLIGIPNVPIGELDSQLTIGVLDLEITDSFNLDEENLNNVLAISAILLACQFAVSCILVKMLQKLITPMKEGEIFRPEVANNIKKLSFYVFIGGFITEIINSAGAILILSAYDTSALFNADLVTNHSFSFELNGNFVVYAAIIYLLSFVFRYGAELQTQVDETL